MSEQEETIQSLDTIIKGDATEQAEVGQEADTKTQVAEVAKVDKKAAPTADGEESWTKTAVLDERRKRQELEAKIAKLEEKKQEAEAVKRPDILEDQEGAFRHTESQFANALLQERINLSRELMIEKHDDYEAHEAVFVEMAQKNPQLVQEMNRSSNPAKFAYNKAKEHNEYSDYQKNKESDDYKAFLEARKAAALEPKEVEETPAQKRNKSAVKVPDLINATSAKTDNAHGEKSLKQLLGR